MFAGGQAAQAPAERHLTDVDWVLAKGLLAAIAGELSAAWGELGGPELTCGEIDLEADAGVLHAGGRADLHGQACRARSTDSPRRCPC